jgi:SLOG cluster2
MSGTRLNITLARYDIGLTGAIPGREHWSEPAMDHAILEFVAFFSGLIFKYGGRIVHGCHPAFTPVILRQARLHALTERSRKPVTLVMSQLWAKSLPSDYSEGVADVAEFVVTKQIGEGGPEVALTRNQSLTEMRNHLVKLQNVMVAVGGKMHQKDGLKPGVQEEMDMAAERGIPRFLLAGLGGYAAEYAKDLVPASLKNGLSDEENAFLFGTNDVSACVSVLFEKLANLS